MNKKKLNIGCAQYPRDKALWHNIDINPNPQCLADEIVDVREGLPYTDNTFDEVWASHFLEHLWSPEVIVLIEEVYRVLQPDGLFTIVVPLNEICELDHLTMFNETSFDELMRPDRAAYHNRTWAWKQRKKRMYQNRNRADRPPLPCMKLELVAVK